MGFIKLVCPNCGANIELSEDREFGFCTYCGTKIMRDTIVVEHRGNVSVSGIASVQSLLDRISLFIEGSEWDKALAYCERVLDMDPYNADAYTLKLLAQAQVSRLDALSGSSKPLTKYGSYENAVRFAPPEKADRLKELNALTVRNYNNMKVHFESELHTLSEQGHSKSKHANRIKFWANGSIGIRIWIAIIAFIVIAETEGKPLAVVLSIAAVIAAFVYTGIKKKEYASLQKELSELDEARRTAQNKYNTWKAWTNTYER